MKTAVFNYLKDAFDMSDDEARDVLEEYLAMLRESCGKAKAAYAAGDLEELGKIGHSIKGCAMNSGHEEMRSAAYSLEQGGKAKAVNCGDLLNKVVEIAEAILNEK